MKSLKIFTDGACSGNQSAENFGGWGAVLVYGEHQKELSGGEADTTNNRMELTALLRALEAVTKDGQNMEVYSDSSYLVNCFRKKWYQNWLDNGWRTAGKKPVENQDLWKAIIPYLEKHRIKFFNVKGHINLKGKKTDIEALLGEFLETNGGAFTRDEFIYIVEKNNQADALANSGVDSVKRALKDAT